MVVEAIRERLDDTATEVQEMVPGHLVRVEVKADCLSIELIRPEYEAGHHDLEPPHTESGAMEPNSSEKAPFSQNANLIIVPWCKAPARRRREIIMPQAPSSDSRPIRAETRAKLVGSIARGRRWLAEVVAGNTSIDDIAAREGCSPRHVTMTISLSFLAPDLIKAALDGRLPRGIGVTRLADPPTEWSRQYKMLGLA